MIRLFITVLGVCVMLSPAYSYDLSAAKKENGDALALYRHHSRHYRYHRRGIRHLNSRVGYEERQQRRGDGVLAGLASKPPVPYGNISGSMVLDMTGRSSYTTYDRSQADTCGGVYATY
jgi:hypothetical protein